MPSQLARVQDLKGLTPAVDARRQEGFQMLSGDNVFFDSDGVISGFGSDYLVDLPLGSGEHVQGIRVRIKTGDRVFTFTDRAILEYDEVAGTFTVIQVIADTSGTPYRWTSGFLNGWLFFCHPAAGIIYVSTTSEARGRWNDVADLTITSPLSVAVNNGRLVIIDADLYYWSEISDGFTFTPSLGGAGAQKINDRISGKPLLCMGYAQGVLTLTTGGIMRSEFTGDQAVFRHRALNTEYSPINSMCVFKTVDDEVVFLDKRGFFSSAGGLPKAFTPLWNEFLIKELSKFRLLERENIRVEWDDNARLLYLSVSESDITPLYDYAYVLYPPLDKWGRFSVQHYAILPFDITTSERRRAYHGYIGVDLKPRIWTGAPHVIVTSASTVQYLWQPLVQYPTHVIDVGGGNTGTVSASACRVSSLNERSMTGVGGYYTFDSADPFPPEAAGLAAKVRIGLFRFALGEYPDEMSEITDITVGSVASTDGLTPVEDYLTVPDGVSDEDYNAGIGSADYGFGRVSYVNFNMDIIASTDGRSAYDVQTPVLARFFANQRFYAVNVVGLYHIVELRADTAGQTFHLQMLELNGMLAGRLD